MTLRLMRAALVVKVQGRTAVWPRATWILPGLSETSREAATPCRERSSRGANGEPGEVIPGPRGARPPPARLLVATAETRAGLSALLGQSVRPEGPGPWDAQRRQVELPRRPASPTLSCDQARPGLAGLVPQRRGHLALPQDPTARRAAGGATPPQLSPS